MLSKVESFHFAGFIITYKRPLVLVESIKKIFAQTLSPQKLLILDNGDDLDTERFINELSDYRVQYYRVGYNSGPAGAAAIGLRLLVDDGFDWIYWGDDNDPPSFNDSFEILLKNKLPLNPGIIGAVGSYLSKYSGKFIRLSDRELIESSKVGVDFIEVHSIAGGQSMIVSASVIKSGVLPNSDLFFGFEELDFCLRVKAAGFKILVSPKLFLKSRVKYSRLNFRQPLWVPFEYSNLTRQYYSIRNLLFIYYQQRYWLAIALLFFKSSIKMVWGLNRGFKYGLKNIRLIYKAHYHAIIGRFGLFID